MAVTVLRHMKESKGSNKAAHLQHAIHYIMNPEKTEGGLWTGSNCGNNEKEIYQTMIDTKSQFEKEWGRQGYHFVISFPPDEDVDEKTVYEFGKQFCQEYLKDNYEYCFAVHNDHDHLHCHIIFNSVDRIVGNKYRYVNGDWEKRIQPVTDRLCREYGLSELVYDKSERIGKSYVEHMAQKDGKIVWSDIIRADIDAAASRSYSREEFMSEMKKMGYQVRQGNSAKHGLYLAYTPPGSKKARRDYNLGIGYRPADIDRKIMLHEEEKVSPVYVSKMAEIKTDNAYQAFMVLRIRQATMYQIFRQEELDQVRVRKDLLHIHQLEQECEYLMKHPINGEKDLEARLKKINETIRIEQNRQQANSTVLASFAPEERILIQRYQDLQEQAKSQELSDEAFEDVLEQIETMELKHPDVVAYANVQLETVPDSMQMQALKEERLILKRIRKDIKEVGELKEVALRQEKVEKQEVVIK